MCHIVHMKAISIRELHLQTGTWLRRIRQGGPIVVTDRGRPIVTLVPFDERSRAKGLPDRESEILKLPRIPVDSATFISEDRDRQ